MVVPVNTDDISVNLSETKKYVGNNLKLQFPQNKGTMLVIGNDASLKVTQNFGVVKVIGNNCVVDIADCLGTVEYVGNNGKIYLEGDVRANTVKYVGINGNLICKKKKRKTDIPKDNAETVNNTIPVPHNVRIRNPHIEINMGDFMPFSILIS